MLLHHSAPQLDPDLADFPKHSIKKRGDVDPNTADEITFPTLYIAIVYGKMHRKPNHVVTPVTIIFYIFSRS